MVFQNSLSPRLPPLSQKTRRVETTRLLESVRGAIATEEYDRIQELGCLRFVKAGDDDDETGRQREKLKLSIVVQELGLVKDCIAVFYEPGRIAGVLARLHARLEAVGSGSGSGADDPVQEEEGQMMVLVRFIYIYNVMVRAVGRFSVFTPER